MGLERRRPSSRRPRPAASERRGRMIMAILRIARMGNPVLHKMAEPVADLRAPDIARLAADMR